MEVAAERLVDKALMTSLYRKERVEGVVEAWRPALEKLDFVKGKGDDETEEREDVKVVREGRWGGGNVEVKFVRPVEVGTVPRRGGPE